MKHSNDGELACTKYLRERGLIHGEMLIDYLERHKGRWQNDINEIGIRHDFIRKFGFAILSKEGIEAIRPYAPIVEIGAGSGYWAYELQRHGVEVIATDDPQGEYGFFRGDKPHRWKSPYTKIEELNSVEAVRKYPNHTLLTVWPDYDESWAADALDIYTGQTVIYMGEGEGNATADDRFHDILNERFSDQDYVPMPHFWGSYDRDLRICKQPKQLKGNI